MAITLVQSKSADAGSVTSTTLAFTNNVASGNFKTCLIRTGSFTATNSASDSLDGAYTQDVAVNNGGSTGNLLSSINSKPNATAGATTVTASQSTTTTLRIVIQEVSGIVTSTPLDQKTGTFGNSTSPASGAVTTLQANEFLCGFIIGNNAVAFPITAGTGWTLDQQLTASADRIMSEYQIVSATGSYNATGSIGSADGWIALIATYKGSGAAAAPFIPIDLDERVTTKVIASDFAGPNLLADQVLKQPPFVQKEFPTQAPGARGVFTDFNPANLLADQLLKPPPITQEEFPGWALQAKGNYTDFAPPNLLADQVLKLPPFTQRELSGAMLPARGITDFIHPNLIESTLLPAPRPLTPVDLSQQVKFRWVATDFNAPNLSFTLPVITNPVAPQDLSFTFNARWVGSDFLTQNLLTGHLPVPPIAPVDATISIRAKGVFTDFSPPNLTLSTLVPPAALHPLDTSLRLEYRWIRGDDLPLNLLPLKLQTAAPIAPQDLSGMRLDAPALRSDFVPPNLTLTLPVPPPPPPSAAAGRHGTRRQARRRRELDVLRARIEAFKEQRADADRALMAAEDREVKARSQILKRVRVRTQELRKPLEQYAPIKKAVAQRAVATDRYRSILGQIRAHQLEADRIQREIESEAADEQAALHLMHYLMMEIPWDE